jgi:UDP-glucose 4-epimerase
MQRLAADPDELVVHGDGTERRNPSHVDNIVEAILVVAERAPMTGEAYNVGSPDSVSVMQMATDIAQAMGIDPKISTSGARGAGHARTWLADISLLESLGYTPRISYREGLGKTVEWFRSASANVVLP